MVLTPQIKLPPPAKDFIQKLLCNVEDRLGTRTGSAEVKVGACTCMIVLLWRSPCIPWYQMAHPHAW